MSGPCRHPLLVLKGTKPGLLDPAQAARILGSPDSTLSFAVFSSDTAMGNHPRDFTTDTLVNTFPSKRIVIETLSGRISRWRFVPRAISQPGLDTEGVPWPKVVDLCGESVIFYEEQWDIYTLDPAYECIFVAAPGRPIIRLKGKSGQPGRQARTTEVEEPSLHRAPGPSAQSAPAESPPTLQEPDECRERQSMEVDELPLRTEPVVRVQPVRSATEEPQICQAQSQDRGPQSMEVDEVPLQPTPSVVHGQPAPSAAVEEQQTLPVQGQDDGDQGMQARNTPLSNNLGLGEGSSNQIPDVSAGMGRTADSAADPLDARNSQRSSMRPRVDTIGREDAVPTPMVEKRTASQCADDEDGPHHDSQSGSCATGARAQKRPRMTPNPDPRPSPFRETQKRYAFQYVENGKKAQELREKKLIEELRSLALQEQASSVDPLSKGLMTNEGQSSHMAPVGNMLDEDLQYSRCLEGEGEQGPVASTPAVQNGGRRDGQTSTQGRDWPEEEQRAKAAEEEQRAKAAEEQRAKAAEEEQQAKAAEEQRAKVAKEEKRRARAAQEQQQLERAAAEAAAEEEKRRANEQARQQEIQRLRLEWSQGDWTAARAIQRYIRFFEEFKTCTFLPDCPVEFDLIPWPVLWEPRYLRFQTPTWQAVEEFFRRLREVVPSRAYPAILNQAKLHFHPDRLSGRRILASLDKRDHDRAREGFGIVVQAVGSLISELRDET